MRCRNTAADPHHEMAVDTGQRRFLFRLYRAAGKLPIAVQSCFGHLVYCGLYHITGYRRTVVQNNLKRAFPDKNAKELTLLEKKYYRHLSQLALELLRAMHMPQFAFTARVTQSNPEVLRQCSANYQRSVMILTIHQGNWEWLLHGISAVVPLPFVAIYKPLHSTDAELFMQRLRRRFGAATVPVRRAARDIMARRDTARCIVMLADQSPVTAEHTHWPLFFGTPTAFHAGPARLAAATGHAVVFARCSQPSPGHYCVDYEVLAEAGQAVDETQLTQRYASAAEAAINSEPHSWLWSNRRWKRA